MKGRGVEEDPFLLLDDDDQDVDSNDNFDFLNLGHEMKARPESEADIEVVEIRDNTRPSGKADPKTSSGHNFASSHLSEVICLPWVVIDSCNATNKEKFRAGETIELRDTEIREGYTLNSGDFLRVKCILQNLQTDEVKVRGYLMRRTKYYGQIFDWKLNELVMVLEVAQDDPTSPFVQGVQEVALEKVIGKRNCEITSKAYPAKTWQETPIPAPFAQQDKMELRQWMFMAGPLACRWIHVIVKQSNGNSYSGIIRSFRDSESDDHQVSQHLLQGSSNEVKKVEASDKVPNDRPSNKPKVPGRLASYTFGDVFCGAGGASEGARQAGLHVLFGVDNDPQAMKAYRANFPDAHTRLINVHKLLEETDFHSSMKVHILHLSPPCCYWSPAHTRDGPNDQANFEAIYTVGPMLGRIKPRVATLEQTYGLLTHEQHKRNFKFLMHDILMQGYDVRYKVQDMSEFGLPQQRKRLLVIAGERGKPLPWFPKPTHGPAGSGLKRFVSVEDAMSPLTTSLTRHDNYHRPNAMARIYKDPYDAGTSMLSCITTSGGDNHHPSGDRHFTARELSLFQSFPLRYTFTGSQTVAKKQIGNAFPPVMAKVMYQEIAQTLEAFDNGFINVDDDGNDLEEVLTKKGIDVPAANPARPSLLNAFLPHQASRPKFRYLRKSDGPLIAISGIQRPSLPLFGRRSRFIEPLPPRQYVNMKKKKTLYYGLIEDSDEEDDSNDNKYAISFDSLLLCRSKKRTASDISHQEQLEAAKKKGKYMELSD